MTPLDCSLGNNLLIASTVCKYSSECEAGMHGHQPVKIISTMNFQKVVTTEQSTTQTQGLDGVAKRPPYAERLDDPPEQPYHPNQAQKSQHCYRED